MSNSIRYRLLTWFIACMLLTAGLWIPANLIFNIREKKVTQVGSQINALHFDFLRDEKTVHDFLTLDHDAEVFYIHGQSPSLIAHDQFSKKIQSGILTLNQSKTLKSFGIEPDLKVLDEEIKRFDILFDSLLYLVYKRGYSEFGLEGEHVESSSRIEKAAGITARDIYELKKTETGYYTSKNAAAIVTFKSQISILNKQIKNKAGLSSLQKAHSAELLNNYAQSFLRLVEVDEQTGISRNRALSASLNETAERVESKFSEIYEKTIVRQHAMMSRLKIFYGLSVILILGMAIAFSYYASKRIVRDLESLARYISSLSQNKNDLSKTVDLSHSAIEIRQIYDEFRNLLSQGKIWEMQRDNAIRFADDNQQRYQELTDMLPQSVFETDSYGNYTYVNKAWYQAFGYEPLELAEGLNLIETLISESCEDDILGIRKIENSNFTAIRKNGTKFPASVYTDNIMQHGKIAGRRGIIIDITDRLNYILSLQQETSKAKTSDELKSSFLANMSHEIRTPMNSIIGFSKLLASDHIPDLQKKDFTQYIQTSSEILLNLVDDIIDIAKIEAGELKIVKKDCDLYALGNELLQTSLETRKRFNKNGIQLFFKADPALTETRIKTDPFRLRQILVNLINNAIKFTDAGSVEFGYSVPDDSRIEFYVKDTGPGLTREELDMIFERFKRARRSEEKNIVGTGLGLAIAKNLVQLLGGEMWVDSTANVGTTFLFTIPYLRITAPLNDSEYIIQDSEYNWKGKTVLIVEDDENSYKYLNELLRKTEVEILHASNGVSAVEMVKENDSIDLVIMDIRLPLMDGIEATRLIKKHDRRIPVIAQTAYAMAGDKEKMQMAGCDDYVSKPINSQTILSTIHHFLIQKPARKKQFEISPGKAQIIPN